MAHGPVPRDFSFLLNKRFRRRGQRVALSQRLREGRLVPGHGEERGAGAAHRDLPSEADLATRQRALTKRQFFGKDPPKNMHWDFL